MTEWDEALRIRRLATTPCQISWAEWNIDRVRGVIRAVPEDACAYPWGTQPPGNITNWLMILAVIVLGYLILRRG